MRYKGKVYRPPSEAYSLIVQVTYGCSHNTCAFCSMFKEKRFAVRPLEEVLEDFRIARGIYRHVERVFLADLGAFTLAGKYAPHCQRHISTQQSIANHVCAQAWCDLGASRVVLARELSLEEIAAIRARVSPELELEVFCHGAMCVSYSGRCRRGPNTATSTRTQ